MGRYHYRGLHNFCLVWLSNVIHIEFPDFASVTQLKGSIFTVVCDVFR